MPVSLEEEICQIQTDKRSRRKRQLTSLDTEVKKLQDTPCARIRPGDNTKRLSEANRLSALFEVLQERYEELITGTDAIGEEISQGNLVKERNTRLIEILEILLEKIALYDEGTVILESLSTLLEVDSVSKPVYLNQLKILEERTTEFKRNSCYHSIYPDIESLRGKLNALLKEVQEQITREQDSLSSACTPLVPEIIVKTKPSSSHRLRITLPKFDGIPLEWKHFSHLFITVVAKDEADR